MDLTGMQRLIGTLQNCCDRAHDYPDAG